MDEIFYLVRNGGSFTYWDVYEMPTYLRKYNVKKLSSEIQEENAKIEAARKGQTGDATLSQLATGNMDKFKSNKPDYTIKRPRK